MEGDASIVFASGKKSCLFDLNMTVEEVKMRMLNYDVFRKLVIEMELDDAVQDFRLLFGGHQMENDKTLEFYGIEVDDTIHLVLRLLGGMAKKGVKKLTKQQKVHEMRARVQYVTAQFPMRQGA